jgi:hypothetical protein
LFPFIIGSYLSGSGLKKGQQHTVANAFLLFFGSKATQLNQVGAIAAPLNLCLGKILWSVQPKGDYIAAKGFHGLVRKGTGHNQFLLKIRLDDGGWCYE